MDLDELARFRCLEGFDEAIGLYRVKDMKFEDLDLVEIIQR